MLSLMILNSPLEQFDVIAVKVGHPMFEFFFVLPFFPQFLLTNSGVFFLITLIFFIGLMMNYLYTTLWLPTGKNPINFIMEGFFQELTVLVYRNVGLKVGQLYLPVLLTTFFMIAGLNLVGMVPFAFTVTSHIIVTFSFSFILFVGINIRAMVDKKLAFFSLFLPSGAPVVIAPFLILIEIISYIARVFSLAIRLFANMMAGHTLLKILIGFSYLILIEGINTQWPLLLVGLIPFFLVYIITFLEVAIALLQGYVFTVLLCLYIKDLYVAH